MDSLSNDNKAKVRYFKELTLEPSEEKCVEYLEAFSWNLEDAILSYVSGYNISSHKNAPRRRLPVPRVPFAVHHPIAAPSTQPQTERSQENDVNIETENTSMSYIYKSVFMSVSYIFTSIFQFTKSNLYYFFSSIVNIFISHRRPLERKYKNFFDIFRNEGFKSLRGGNFISMQLHANHNKKPILCVTLKDYNDETVDEIKKLLLNEDIKNIINEKFILWGVDRYYRTQILSLKRTLLKYPHFEVILPGRSYTFTPKSTVDPSVIEDLKKFLLRDYSKYLVSSPTFSSPSNQLNRSNERDLLIQQQKEEFDSFVKAEQEKEEILISKGREKLREEEAKLKLKNDKERIKNLFIEARENALTRVSSSLANQSLCHELQIFLKIKYPDGRIDQLPILPSESISILCDKIILSNKDIMSNFYLFSNIPKTQICHFNVTENPDLRTLFDCHIKQSQVIMLEYDDEEASI